LPLTPAQISAFDDWWAIIIKCMEEKKSIGLFSKIELMVPVKLVFAQHDVNLNGVLNGEESVGFFKVAWTAAHGEGEEPEASIAAKLKALKSLNVDTGDSFSWEDYERSM
jgi:hypothetical protein